MKRKKLVILCVVLLVIDQLTKFLVHSNMELYQSIPVIGSFFKLYYIRNDGAAFSMFSGQTTFFYIVSIIAIGVVIYLYKESKSKLSYIATTLLLAGTLGNLIDRILFKEVVDFFSFTFFNYSFAIFNVADIYVVLAVALLLFDSLRKEESV